MHEHRKNIELLERGISPDSLPLNPPRISRTSLQHGWYRYEWLNTNTYERLVDWFRIGPVEERN